MKIKIENKIDHKIKRQNQVDAGMYDGRFRTKIVADKKKKQSKCWARNK